MSRFDRYLLSHLLALFGFFSLVLVAVYWVNRAVMLFDDLIGDGQSALVFLEFSLLTLPNVIRLVLPLSAFAATVYGINRLAADSELVVMQATGFSSFRLARPVLWFGLIVALMVMVLAHVLVPASRAALSTRSAELAEDMTSRYLNEGEFMHPARGVTLFISEVTATGEIRELFLADDRDAGSRRIYTARRALLARGDSGPKLVMFDGMLQRLGQDQGAAGAVLSVTRFADFTYDLAALFDPAELARRSIDELYTPDLLAADPALIEETRATRAEFLAEAHARIATPFTATASALIGFSALLLGGFSRFGLWRQIAVAVLLIVAVQAMATAGMAAALKNAAAWPLAYGAPLFGLAAAGVMLWLSQRPRRLAVARSSVRNGGGAGA